MAGRIAPTSFNFNEKLKIEKYNNLYKLLKCTKFALDTLALTRNSEFRNHRYLLLELVVWIL